MTGSAIVVDAHCHSVLVEDLDEDRFGQLCTESSQPAAPGTSYLRTPLMLSIRRWCAPVLDLPAHAPVSIYLRRRRELGGAESSRRLLRAAGLSALLVDTGYGPGQLGLDSLADLGDAPTFEVCRLETLATALLVELRETGAHAGEFPHRFRAALREVDDRVVAFKSVLAYRHGFDVPGERPDDDAVVERVRITHATPDDVPWTLIDPILLRFILWEALLCPPAAGRIARPVQLHVGYGDDDLDLHRTNPLLLTDLIRAAARLGAAPVVLLHCYPYHREAAYLASVYPNVYFDLGLAAGHLGPSARTVVSEALELAPFGKLHYSSDGCALAELFYVGARSFTRGLDETLADWLAAGDVLDDDAAVIRDEILSGSARRLYPGLHDGLVTAPPKEMP